MKYIISILVLITILYGCSREYWDYTNRVQKICIEGYVYYEYKNSIAPKLNPDGTPFTCLSQN